MRKTNKIKYSDIKVLASLFAGENANISINDDSNLVIYDETIVFNTGKSIIFNFSKNNTAQLFTYDFIVDFTNTNNPLKNTTNFYALFAPDQTLRYLLTKKNTNFLAFYGASSLRAKIIKLGLKSIFNFGLSSKVLLPFQVYYTQQLSYTNCLTNLNYDHVSIFTGAPGHWRKPVIQVCNQNHIMAYAKYSINAQSKKLVQKERKHLLEVQDLHLERIISPKVLDSNSTNAVLLENISSRAFQHTTQLSNQHVLASKELMLKTFKNCTVEETLFYDKLRLRIAKLQLNKEFQKEAQQLNILLENLDPDTPITTAVAHGDFTPWNTAYNYKSIICYDWEMKIDDAPFLYDLFHYIYQTESLINRKGFKRITKRLELLVEHRDLKGLIANNQAYLNTAHKLYLMDVVSKNLCLIEQQEHITNDQKLMIENWMKSVCHHFRISPKEHMRKTFLRDFLPQLDKVKYVLLKNLIDNFEDLPEKSDLDIAVNKQDTSSILEFIKNHSSVKKTNIRSKSFMTTVEIHFLDYSFLSIDLIHDFIRKGKRYLDINKLLTNRVYKNGYYNCHILDDIEYAQQFYTLNFSSIPVKYQQYYYNQIKELRLEGCYLKHLDVNYKIKEPSPVNSFKYTPAKRNKFVKHNKSTYKSSLLKRLKLGINYLNDTTLDLLQNRGFLLTFSGVDGAGKTTIINDVKKTLEYKYRKEVVMLRHRPGILPILSSIKYGSSQKAEQVASNNLPRQGTNKSFISSLLRFSYYFTDYLLGQIWVYFKYILRGKIVIYDRYYYDFINDAKRSNINLSSKLIQSLYFFIYKPEYNFYLFNTPEVILARKKELSKDDITGLNLKYSSLFNKLKDTSKGKYRQIKNDDREETVTKIIEDIYQIA